MRKTAYVSVIAAVTALGAAGTASAADVTTKAQLSVTDGQLKTLKIPSSAFATTAKPVLVNGTSTVSDTGTPATATLAGFTIPATALAPINGLTTATSGVTINAEPTVSSGELKGTQTLTGTDAGKVVLGGDGKLTVKATRVGGTAAGTATCTIAAPLTLETKSETAPAASGATPVVYAGKVRTSDGSLAVNDLATAGAPAAVDATGATDAQKAASASICGDLGVGLGLTGDGSSTAIAFRLAGTLGARPTADFTGAFNTNLAQLGTKDLVGLSAATIPLKTDADTTGVATLTATKAGFVLPTVPFSLALGSATTPTAVTATFAAAADVNGTVNLKDGAEVTGKTGLFFDTTLPASLTTTYTFAGKTCTSAATTYGFSATRATTNDVTLGSGTSTVTDQALSQADSSVAYTAAGKIGTLTATGNTAQSDCTDLAAKYAAAYGTDDLKLRLGGFIKPTVTGTTPTPTPAPFPTPIATPTPTPTPSTTLVKAKPRATVSTPKTVRRGRTVTLRVRVRNNSSKGIGTKIRLRVSTPKGLRLSGSSSKTVGTLGARKSKTITVRFRTSRSTKSSNLVRLRVTGSNSVSSNKSVRVRVR